jgi:hypothetical protein
MSESRGDLQAVRQLAAAALARTKRRDVRGDAADAAFAALLTRRPIEHAIRELEMLEAAE